MSISGVSTSASLGGFKKTVLCNNNLERRNTVWNALSSLSVIYAVKWTMALAPFHRDIAGFGEDIVSIRVPGRGGCYQVPGVLRTQMSSNACWVN